MKRNDAETVFNDIYTTLLEKQRDIGDLVDGYFSNTPKTTIKKPAVDILDDDDVIIVNIDLPGIERDDIKIDITETYLDITADYTDESAAEKTFLRKERYNEILTRKIPLPEKLDINSSSAKFQAGVLSITIPKIVDENSFEVKVD